MARKTVLAVGDVHAPFHSAYALKIVYSLAKEIKPDVIVQMGDIFDWYSFSRFPKKPGVIHPSEEIEQGHDAICEFWKSLQQASPHSTCYQLLGNHSVRPLKLTMERCPELYPLILKSWKELYKFKGVSTLFDTRDDLVIDDTVYEHGSFTQPGQHMRDNMKSTVIAHTHRGYVHVESIRDKMLFELNAWYVADPTNEALKYTRKNIISGRLVVVWLIRLGHDLSRSLSLDEA